MPLRGLNLPLLLNTSTNDFVEEFFLPALSNSCGYDRGVGYFSSSWIKKNSIGLSQFAENDGHARWVTSPILSKSDWQAICLGSKARQDEILYEILAISIDNLRNELEKDELSALAWLIADNVIDFRLAVPRNQLIGEFHDKFGIFTDSCGDKISFSGSYNDSVHGLLNYESIMVFKSWEKEFEQIVNSEQQRFNLLWDDSDPNVKVYILPESIKNQIVRFRNSERPYQSSNKDRFILISPTKPHLPNDLKIRDYQNKAVTAWLENNYRGFLEMATGTGKTITSLLASLRFYDLNKRIALIIACPYKHLVTQWKGEVSNFGYSPVIAYESYASWKDILRNKIIAFNHRDIDNICIITTHNTLDTDKFSSQILKIDGPVMMIADEAHHLGTKKFLNFSNNSIQGRLALSATPNRWFDKEGTKILFDYFGPSIFSFTLRNAIDNEFLTQYYYYPILVCLSDQEAEEYSQLSKRIIPLQIKKEREATDEERLKFLLLKRANILKNAKNKLTILKDYLQNISPIEHSIFYCSPEQKDQVLYMLGIDKGIKTHQFTYQEDNTLRQDILDQFNQGLLQAIVAIKCLDEGVDVPSTRIAFFLANSSNPREFIQRRGRVLRKFPGKDFAYLYDFLTIPPEKGSHEDQDLGRSIMQKELGRFKEFADNCVNFHSANEVIWDIAQKYGIIDY